MYLHGQLFLNVPLIIFSALTISTKRYFNFKIQIRNYVELNKGQCSRRSHQNVCYDAAFFSASIVSCVGNVFFSLVSIFFRLPFSKEVTPLTSGFVSGMMNFRFCRSCDNNKRCSTGDTRPSPMRLD